MIAQLSDDDAKGLLTHWPFWARPNQIEPPGDWDGWIIIASRGFGKTRNGAEMISANVGGDTPLSGGR